MDTPSPGHRSRHALTAVLIAGVVMSSAIGCAAATPIATPTPTVAETPSPTPTPTPTPEALVVGPGERPPLVADGDCSAVITSEELTEQLGIEIDTVEERGEVGSVDVVGGIICRYWGAGVSGSIQVLPQQELVGAELSDSAREYYFSDCTWVCAWVYEDDRLWISGSLQHDAMSQDKTDAWGAIAGPAIAEAVPVAELWVRERTGWWGVPDCEQLAVRLEDRLGVALVGDVFAHPDAPLPSVLLAEEAIDAGMCSVTDPASDVNVVMLWTASGAGWSVPSPYVDEPVELGTTGVGAFRSDGAGYLLGATYEMTDGINVASAEVRSDWSIPEEQIATVLAELIAEGF